VQGEGDGVDNVTGTDVVQEPEIMMNEAGTAFSLLLGT
jgi:hypothetical protein